MKELVKGNLKIIEVESRVYNEVFKNYILKKQTKNGIWRTIKKGNLGNDTLEERLAYEISK